MQTVEIQQATYSEMIDQEILSSLIQERRREIHVLKESWRPLLPSRVISGQNILIPIKEGTGGAYYLYHNEVPRFVIKPVDEDIYCLHNRKKKMSPFNDLSHQVRPAIPLYHSAQIETCCYAIATLSGLREVTPPTWMELIVSDAFFDISQEVSSDPASYFSMQGQQMEKLCSVQE